MDEFDALAKGKQLVEKAMGRSQATSPQSEADLTRTANQERRAQPREEPVFLNELMTRRDFFAAAALTGMLSRPCHVDDKITIPECAEDAYRYADAMLEARGQSHGQ